MASISRALRTTIIERANGLCEYCQTSQLIVLEIEIDHIQPESKGGLTEESNICLACPDCNSFKNDAEEAIDPQTREIVALFNPRTQSWTSHFE